MADIAKFRFTQRPKFSALRSYLDSLGPREKSEWLRQAALEKLEGKPVVEQIEQMSTENRAEHSEQVALLNKILATVKKSKRK